MHRILLIGPNYAFPRASARPASATGPLTSPSSLARQANCEAGFYSGMAPDTAPDGIRSCAVAGPPPTLHPLNPAAGVQSIPDSDEEFVW